MTTRFHDFLDTIPVKSSVHVLLLRAQDHHNKNFYHAKSLNVPLYGHRLSKLYLMLVINVAQGIGGKQAAPAWYTSPANCSA